MNFEVLRTADDGHLVAGNHEATRYDYLERLRGPIDLSEFNRIKGILGYYETIEADTKRDALNKFIELNKPLH